jgi:hypothetical protein
VGTNRRQPESYRALSQSQQAIDMNCIAYEWIWAQPTPTYALLGRKPQRREGHQEDHKEIQKEKIKVPVTQHIMRWSTQVTERMTEQDMEGEHLPARLCAKAKG